MTKPSVIAPTSAGIYGRPDAAFDAEGIAGNRDEIGAGVFLDVHDVHRGERIVGRGKGAAAETAWARHGSMASKWARR